jgi:hypothetical protein
MKQSISKFISGTFHCSTHYSGQKKIMFVRGKRRAEAVVAAMNKFRPSFSIVASSG